MTNDYLSSFFTAHEVHTCFSRFLLFAIFTFLLISRYFEQFVVDWWYIMKRNDLVLASNHSGKYQFTIELLQSAQ